MEETENGSNLSLSIFVKGKGNLYLNIAILGIFYKQAGAELCQAQFKFGLVKSVRLHTN